MLPNPVDQPQTGGKVLPTYNPGWYVWCTPDDPSVPPGWTSIGIGQRSREEAEQLAKDMAGHGGTFEAREWNGQHTCWPAGKNTYPTCWGIWATPPYEAPGWVRKIDGYSFFSERLWAEQHADKAAQACPGCTYEVRPVIAGTPVARRRG